MREKEREPGGAIETAEVVGKGPRGSKSSGSPEKLSMATAILLASAAMAGCTGIPGLDDEIYVGGSPSVLPNIGLALEAGQVFRRTPKATWSFEVETTYQFLDDEDISNDGNPSAGSWVQAQGGVKALLPRSDARSWTVRFGAVWFRAKGEPNIVQKPGDYVGGYGGLGFETRISEHWSMGPELSLMVVSREKTGFNLDVVPQINWHLIWAP